MNTGRTPSDAFAVVYEDAHLLVVNKIAKIVVQPTERERVTLPSLIEKSLSIKVYPCHRLDRETTGLMIYAKSRQDEQAIVGEFKRGEVKKKYVAFVSGHPIRAQGELSGYIIDDEGRRFGEKPKLAKTLYAVKERLDGFSVVELTPLTGRTNQLRIQLARIKHPILGERKYAFGRDFTVRFKRLALHACSLAFKHPHSQEPLSFSIDLPQDMKTFLEQARNIRKKV